MTFLQHLTAVPNLVSYAGMSVTRGTKSQSFAAARANTSAARHPDMALSAARAASSTVVHGGKVGSARAQKPRQLCGNAPSLVAGEQLGRRSTSRLLLEIDVGERLPIGVADGAAALLLVDRPWRREAQRRGHGEAAQRQNAPPATPEAARGLLRALVVLAQQLSSSTSRAFVASAAHHFW